MSDTYSDGTEHFINVRSVQLWKGGFDAELIDEDGNLHEGAEDLQFRKEISLSFECECGDRFHTWENAADHLHSLQSDTDR